MREVCDGVRNWTAVHPNIEMEVNSYYAAPARTLIDPMATDEILEHLRGLRRKPDRIVLTNRHHLRDSVRFSEEFEIPILCHRAGLYEFADRPEVEGFAFGDELGPKLKALEVGAICEDETGIHLDVGPGVLAIGDAVINYDGLGFVPDEYLGDNPEVVKEQIRRAFGRLLDRRFDALLFAHGTPIPKGGHAELMEFVES